MNGKKWACLLAVLLLGCGILGCEAEEEAMTDTAEPIVEPMDTGVTTMTSTIYTGTDTSGTDMTDPATTDTTMTDTSVTDTTGTI
ncbi:MAG TPA: hypothetical protein VM534_01040 [Thermoanaerobaculia bacterium]|nr:hypothetical protein [Thermoanaerobaculia bacterium]